VPQNSDTPSYSTLLRWTALIVVEASIAFIFVYSNLSTSATLADVASEYGNALLSIGFAKAIGLAVLVGFLCFFVVALWPRRRRMQVYDSLVVLLALASILGAGWLVTFRREEIGLSVGAVAASVVLGGVMFARVASVSPGRHSYWLRVPFSMYFGAMTLALLVVVTQWLNVSGLIIEPFFETHDVAIGFLVIAVASGGLVALRYRDFVYPTVITCGLASMFLAQRTYEPDLATPALIASGGMLLVAGLAALALATRPSAKPAKKALRDPVKKRSRRRVKVARRATPDEVGYQLNADSTITRF
jgi:hypothetical protein